MTAKEYIKEKWGDNWLRNSWEPGDVIDALEEFAKAYHEAKLKEITDKDIEAWVDRVQPTRGGYRSDYIFSVKAILNGKIKHIES